MQIQIPKFKYKQDDCPSEFVHAPIKNQGYGWCKDCGYMADERYIEVKFPGVTIKKLPAFELSKLKEKFKVAEFERKPSAEHVNKIVRSILTNQFYDNIIRVVEKDGIWIIIDAQHRIEALMKCHEKYGLQTYDLVLEIYPLEYARTIYRALNVGKPLRAYDHTYAMDNGKIPFFSELKPWLSHYRQVDKLSFVDMIYSLRNVHAVGKDMGGSITMIDSYMPKITREDIDYCKIFLENTKTDSLAGSMIHKYGIFRNFFRIAYLNELDGKRVAKLLRLIEESEKIKKLYLDRNYLSLGQIQSIIEELVQQV